MERRARLWAGFLGLVLAVTGLIIWNINTGSVHVSPGEIVSILLGGGGDSAVIVRGIRMPRIIAAATAMGAILAALTYVMAPLFAVPTWRYLALLVLIIAGIISYFGIGQLIGVFRFGEFRRAMKR